MFNQEKENRLFNCKVNDSALSPMIKIGHFRQGFHRESQDIPLWQRIGYNDLSR